MRMVHRTYIPLKSMFRVANKWMPCHCLALVVIFDNNNNWCELREVAAIWPFSWPRNHMLTIWSCCILAALLYLDTLPRTSFAWSVTNLMAEQRALNDLKITIYFVLLPHKFRAAGERVVGLVVTSYFAWHFPISTVARKLQIVQSVCFVFSILGIIHVALFIEEGIEPPLFLMFPFTWALFKALPTYAGSNALRLSLVVARDT